VRQEGWSQVRQARAKKKVSSGRVDSLRRLSVERQKQVDKLKKAQAKAAKAAAANVPVTNLINL